MPKVTLEFEVTQKGVSTKQVVSETETALARLGTTAVATSRQHDTLAKSSERAEVSTRQLRQATGALTSVFGQVAPGVTFAAVELGQFSKQMEGASLKSKALGYGMVGLGVAVAGVMKAFEETERIATRFASIDRAVRSLDFSSISSGLAEVNVELEASSRTMSSMIGMLVTGAKNIPVTVMNLFGAGLPNWIEEKNQVQARLREGMQTVLPSQTGLEAAAHGQQVASLTAANFQAYTQNLLQKGMLTKGMEGPIGESIRKLIEEQAYQAKEAIGYQYLKEVAQSAAPDIEGPLLLERRRQRWEQIEIQKATSLEGSEAQDRQRAEAIRGQAESQRASEANLAINQQSASLDVVRRQAAASQAATADRDAYMASKGYQPWQIKATVDPFALQVIDEVKKAKLLALDETLAKETYSIQQLKLQDEDRERMLAQLRSTTAMQRQEADRVALDASNSLYDAARKTNEELLKAAMTASQDLAGGLDKAASSAERISAASSAASDKLGPIGSLSKSNTNPAAGAMTPFNWGNDLGTAAPAMMNTAAPAFMNTAAPAFAGSYDSGGTVPGPVGRPRLAIVHGGEEVIPVGGGGSTGRPVQLTIQVGSRTVATALIPDIQQAIASGELRIG